MKKLAAILLALPLVAGAAPPPGGGGPLTAAAEANLADWVVKAGDNVCGVSNARQITNPAKVNYDALLRATPELKRMKREGIDKDSALGQILTADAKKRIRRVAKVVMTDKGHCSVWKAISHKKGKSIPDITDAVQQKLDD